MVIYNRILCISSDFSGFSYPKRELQIFSSPDLHPGIVGSDVLEVFPVDGKQSARHGRGPGGDTNKKIPIMVSNDDKEVEDDEKEEEMGRRRRK